ncbi:TetR/AcrR family transcriptional regulator [Nocardia gipuzkoensis]|uniref:TetR/AcrR family transcriptional regulator n=1 Tax=Nocardia gipuzkoensis TaxID=2749991 RepID=UPI0015EEE8DC|nr:TetR/AcrR family transcriptional regulator [Nocardia gipuzkoensis]
MKSTDKRVLAAALKLLGERGTTDLTMSELAAEAQVARGTLYRNVESIGWLYGEVVRELSEELHARIAMTLDRHGDLDPAVRLATGVRMFVRMAHENPALGKFVVRFGLTEESLRGILTGPPMRDLGTGLDTDRYELDGVPPLAVASLMIGVPISAVWMVLEGHQGWREAGSAAAELMLRALGIDLDQARKIANADMPALPDN